MTHVLTICDATHASESCAQMSINIAVDSALAELFRSSQFYTNQQKLTDFVVEEVLTDRGLKISEDE